MRRTAEMLRSLLGHQERWLLWRPLDPLPSEAATCHLSASSVDRWLDGAGQTAQTTVPDQLRDVPSSGQLATDGLWARLRGQTKKVVLLVGDRVSGLIWPPVVGAGEEAVADWQPVFERAKQAGLVLETVRGVTSDGAKGLVSYLGQSLAWVSHQRCVFHLWRNLASALATVVTEAALGLVGKAAKQARRAARREMVGLIRTVFDAPTHLAAQRAFVVLKAHPQGKELARLVDEHLDAALVHLLDDNHGLGRASPEWFWRDYRLRLGHGRNHGADVRLERAALLFAIYHNFEPAQERSERTRHYRHPGLCPLAVAGMPPNGISYLDAVSV